MSTAELSALVSRLEAVTSRLERIQTTGGGAGPAEGKPMAVVYFCWALTFPSTCVS